jgi:hypothetical protein
LTCWQVDSWHQLSFGSSRRAAREADIGRSGLCGEVKMTLLRAAWPLPRKLKPPHLSTVNIRARSVRCAREQRARARDGARARRDSGDELEREITREEILPAKTD